MKWELFRRRRVGARPELLESRTLLAADVYISEVVASNELSLIDEDGDSPDWIEIYNDGPDDIDLADWHLTDDPANLQKWSFPSQTLAAGNFLLVHASDKDRSVAGSPLHTNFKLKSGGEYLALTQGADINAMEIVSEFNPQYPFQFTDISYGVAQTVQQDDVLLPSAAAKLFIPQNDALGTSWTSLGFDDGAWTAATAGIGYQQTVPGFTVLDAKSNSSLQNLANAEAVLDGTGQVSATTVIAPLINYRDPGGGGGIGNFGSDALFPNDSPSDDNDFAIRATGTIVIPTAGTWSFGINSDDGARLRIDGVNVINDDTLHAPRDTFGSTTLTAGEHDVELIFFERGGGAEVELFAASGSHSSFNSNFKLIGDVANGGLEVNTSPNGTTSSFSALYQTDVSAEMLNQSTDAYLRIPFNVSNPASLDSLTLRMNYDDGFVAYLNGTEVARRNAPAGAVPGNSAASSDRPRSEAEYAESINISSFLGDLNTGQNLLAIHGLNEAADSDEFVIRAALVDVSTTAGDLYYFTAPSPRDFNPSTGVEGFLTNEITFSHDHGFYEAAFSLSLTAATAGTNVRYTLDGTEPTDTNGIDYVGAITINETTTIRARAFKAGLEPSFVATQTFLFVSDVVNQTSASTIAAGFPASVPQQQVLDYGMDPDVVNDAVWGPQLESALTQIPSMSIVMDVDDLLGDAGIYTNARSHGKEWERPISLELLNPDGSAGFQVNAGLRVRGGFSRSPNNPKHAFRLFFRDEYGDAKLQFPLFGAEGADQFDKVDLRTAQNYSWSFQGSNNNSFMRDVFSRDLQGAMGNPYTRSRFYHLYINGQYWGLFQTQERAEARYADSYFGGSPNDYDVVKSAGSSGGYQNEATDGNLDAYNRLADFFYQAGGLGDANHSDYMRAQGKNPDGTPNPSFERLLDVENLIDYMLITYFTSDADGPGSKFTRPRVNNYFGIFNREDPDGFKFFEHDSEHSLDRGNAAGANYNMVTPLTTGGSQYRYFNPHWMHEQLANTNTEYRIQFMDRVTEQIFNDGLLTPESGKAMIDARAAQIDQAIIAESARWGDAKRSTPLTKNDWLGAVNRAKNFFDGRAAVLLDQLRSVSWYSAQDPPEFLVNSVPQHGGEIGATDTITLATSTSIVFDETLVGTGSAWKYLDNGSDQGTTWRGVGFNDGSWASGNAELGYGDGNESTVVSFGPNANDKYVTTYFRKTFQVTDTSMGALRVRLQRDDGAIVYLNGVEVARSNMPGGAVDYETSATSVTGGGAETAFEEFDIDPSLLVTGNNVLAVEVHQHVAGGGTVTSSDISFDLELLAGTVVAGNSVDLYYTTDGTDPRLPGGAINPSAQLHNPNVGFTLNANATVRVRSKVGTDWGPALVANFTLPGTGSVPVAVDDSATTSEDTPVSGSVATNDTLSADGGNVFGLNTQAANGTAVVDASGNFTYTPDENFQGSDSFTYDLEDVDGDTSTATVTVTVNGVDDVPLAVDDSASGTEDVALSGDVSTNDTLSGDGGNVFSVTGHPAHGSVVLNPGSGTFTYTPDVDYHGPDSFEYQIKDADGDVSKATVAISLASVDDLPVAQPDSIGLNEDTIASGDVSTNDELSGDGGNTFSLVTDALHGSVDLDPDGSYKYTPDQHYFGSDFFVYRLRDADGDQSSATVLVTVLPIDDVPIAVDDSVSGTEDMALSGDVSTNDSLSGDGGNGFSVTGNPSHGSVVLNPGSGTFTYTPDADYHGPDSFEYQIKDVDGDVSKATVAISLASADDVPVAKPDSIGLNEDTIASGDVSTNDELSGDGGNTFSLVTDAANGSVDLDPDGTYTYTPNAHHYGSDFFVYRLQDADGDQSSATVLVTILPIDDFPIAQDDSASTSEDTPVSGSVAANDTLSGDGGNVFSLATQAKSGTAVVGASGSYTYTPDEDFHGTDTFRYQLTDADGDASTATVTVSVSSVNDVPVAQDDSASTSEDTPVSGSVATNDTLSGDGGNVFSLSTQAKSGTAVVGASGSFTYTPDEDFHGTDTFRYQLTDGDGDASTATVTVSVSSVNDVPVAKDDSVSTAEDTPVSGSVATNDTLSGDGGNVFSLSTQAKSGTAVVGASGSFTYTPDEDFHGTDTFRYQLTDADGDASTATVTVSVGSVNDVPVAKDDSASTAEDTPVSGSVASNDTLSGDGGNVFSLATQAKSGTAVVGASGNFTYTPDEDFHGTDTFRYQLTDGDGDASTATVTVSVGSVNDVPVAKDDSASTSEDTPVSGSVASNDTLSGDGGNVFSLSTQAKSGTAVVGASGSFTYTPDEDFHGTDTFRYQLTDGDGDASTATVTVSVGSVNDVPVAQDDSASTSEDTPVSGSVATNDTLSGDGGNVFSLSTQAKSGTAVVGASGSFTYTPDEDFHGTDTFRYQLTDANGDASTATVTVSVGSVNDVPVAKDDSASTAEDTPVSGSVASNDTLSGDGGNVFSLSTQAKSGTAVVGASGSFTYTPDEDFHGTDTFSYQLTDGDGDASTATVTVSVGSVNDLPVAKPDSIGLDEDTIASGDVSTNDELSGDGGNTFSLITDAANGSVDLDPDGTYTYTPNAHYFGSDFFVYRLQDADGDQSSATVLVTILPIDDLPIAQDDDASTSEDTPVSGSVAPNDTLSGDGGNVFSLATQANSGTAVVGASGSYTYTPDEDFHGTDTFRYQLTDADGDASTATVTVSVGSVNDVPIAQDDDVSTAEDTPVSGSVASNDTLSGDGGNVFSLATQANSGTAVVGASGSFTYTPDEDFHGTDTFRYQLTDGDGDASTATVTVSVGSVNDVPIAQDDDVSTAEDTPVSGSVASNDTLSGDGGNTFHLKTPTQHGSLSFAIDGAFTYTPQLNFHGTDSFTYDLRDANGDTSTAAVQLRVLSVDDQPQTQPDTFAGLEDTPLQGLVGENDTLSGDGGNVFSLVTNAENGLVTVNPAGKFTYQPRSNFHGEDRFVYRLRDADGDHQDQTVTLRVASVDDLPEAFADALTTKENTPVAGNVGGNDTFSGDGGNTFAVVSQPSHGQLVMQPTGQFSYTPAPGYFGADAFTYQLRDLDGDASTAEVSIQVTPDGAFALGDLNRDRVLDAADIDTLMAALRAGSSEERYDLDENGRVDDADATYMIETIFGTRTGDADLDGSVDFPDFLAVAFHFGKQGTTWSQGNFDTVEDTSFTDFLLLAKNFGFRRDDGG